MLPLEFRAEVNHDYEEAGVMGLQWSSHDRSLSRFDTVQRRVTDGQTDRQTDGSTDLL